MRWHPKIQNETKILKDIKKARQAERHKADIYIKTRVQRPNKISHQVSVLGHVAATNRVLIAKIKQDKQKEEKRS